ncbi:hypothetical protein [Alcaligenes sp. WGS1538]|uniref:hypothetical protein n=1 Tax=Alcaligenes sp. WGS1538 TaxID=3366811 RepID=UPI00372D45E6
MSIRPPGQKGAQSLQRQDLRPDPARLAGGLGFNAERGAAPRGGNASAARQRGDERHSGLKFLVNSAFPTARSWYETVEQNSTISLLIRSLLSKLAASTDDVQAQSGVAAELARLSGLSQGDLSTLSGGRESLAACMNELTYADIIALRTGVFSRAEVFEAVLSQAPPDLSSQATDVLKQIRQVLNERFVSAFIQEPLEEIGRLLACTAQLKDKQFWFEELLSTLYTGLTVLSRIENGKDAPLNEVLSAYFRTLPESMAQKMLFALRDGQLYSARLMLLSSQERLNSEALIYNQSRSMIAYLRLWVKNEAYAQAEPALRQVGRNLAQAQVAQDRRAGARALCDLDALVLEVREISSLISKEMAEDVRGLIKTGLNLLRDAKNNPAGPLNEHSLQRLDDACLGHVRQTLRLRPYGLDLESAQADAVGLERVEGHGRRAVQGMMDVLRTLAGEKVHMPALLRQLRDLSGLELRRLLHLVELGQFASGLTENDCLALAQETCAQAVDQLSRTRQTVVVRNVMRHMSLLKSLEVEFGKIVFSTKPALAQKAYKGGGMEIGLQLDATYRLLNVMVETLYGLLPEMMERDDSEATIELCEQMLALLGTLSDFEVLPDSFYSALQGQYGVVYDPAADRAAVVVTDAARATLAPELERGVLASADLAQRVALVIDGQPREFVVSRWFYEDGIEHGAITLSVRGGAADGRAVRFMWPDPASPNARLQAMGAALQALDRLAGVHIESLTGLMNYKYMAGAVIKGLWGMGAHAPFKLADGLAIHPDGEAELDFDVKQNADDSLDMETTVTFSNIRKAPGIGSGGRDAFVTLNPEAASWAQVRFTVNVSPDGGQIKVVGLPQFRHHFELESIQQ